jgi:hypothetical protein
LAMDRASAARSCQYLGSSMKGCDMS